MKKLIAGCLVLLTLSAPAQTLFTYGSDSVSVKDFVQAFRKNNPTAKSETAFREYLNLYITSRLKIKEAVANGYDTLPHFVAELQNLRAQILPAYLNDAAVVDQMVQEAFSRSQKDIQLAHIFVSFKQNGHPDSAAARKKAETIQASLKSGKAFADLAKAFSDDPAAKNTGGNLGWITVFSLPYELENLAYTTSPGKISPLYRSKAGYHIFKNVAERKALGRVRAAQILLAFPPEADAALKEEVRKRADSIYYRLQKGDDFARFAAEFSDDAVSAASGGVMQEIGVGEFEPRFESVVFSLSADGAISKPFLTEHGYHIVKRISKQAVPTSKDKAVMQHLKEKVEASDRMAWAQKAMAQRIMKQAGFKKLAFQERELWNFTDSATRHGSFTRPVQLQPAAALFRLGNKEYTAQDWARYAQLHHRHDGAGHRPYEQLWQEYLERTALEYYQAHLEHFNESFRKQVNEFKDGNLFFEIMQKKVWEPAQTDTVGLQAFYLANAANYRWNKSVAAVIFFASDAGQAASLRQELEKHPSDWRSVIAAYSETVAADSGRFELGQIPNAGGAALKPGLITTPVVNKTDNTASFALIVQSFDQPSQKSFAEAKGQVINDYQALLEKQWLEELYKKYPVRINQKILNETLKKKAW